MSRYVVTVGSVELTALLDALSSTMSAVLAIKPTEGDEAQTEAVVNARCSLLAVLKASKKLKTSPVRVEG